MVQDNKKYINSSLCDFFLFFLFFLAMHLFGLNWHLQPMQRDLYQLPEDNTSGLPFPTDLSLPPLGNTGLEIPDGKGKDESKCICIPFL